MKSIRMDCKRLFYSEDFSSSYEKRQKIWPSNDEFPTSVRQVQHFYYLYIIQNTRHLKYEKTNCTKCLLTVGIRYAYHETKKQKKTKYIFKQSFIFLHRAYHFTLRRVSGYGSYGLYQPSVLLFFRSLIYEKG